MLVITLLHRFPQKLDYLQGILCYSIIFGITLTIAEKKKAKKKPQLNCI